MPHYLSINKINNYIVMDFTRIIHVKKKNYNGWLKPIYSSYQQLYYKNTGTI